MTRFTWTAVLLGALLARSVLAANIPGSAFFIEEWRGSAYTDDATHQFSHCAAVHIFPGKPSFIVSKSANGVWGLGIADSRWHLQKGSKYHIGLKIDRIWDTAGDAVSVSDNQVEFYHSNLDFMRAFQAGQVLSITAASTSWSFSLKGTYRVVEALENCVATGGTTTARRTGTANPFAQATPANPFAPAPPRSVANDPFSSRPPQQQPSQTQQASAAGIFSVPARVVPENTLRALFHEASIDQIGDFIQAPKQFPGAAYSWRVNKKVLGMLFEIDAERYKASGKTLSSILSEFMGGVGGSCKGAWASGIKPSDNPAVTRGFGACKADIASESYLMSTTSITLPRAYELFVHFDPGTNGQAGQDIDGRLASVLERRVRN